LMVYLGSFLLDFALAILLASHLGTTGAAIAQAVTLTASNGVRLYLVWRFVHIQPFDRHYARLAIPAAAGGGAMVAVHLALRHGAWPRSEEHTSELQSRFDLVCRLLLEKKN